MTLQQLIDRLIEIRDDPTCDIDPSHVVRIVIDDRDNMHDINYVDLCDDDLLIVVH
jgi:hypothetical protein